VSISPTKALTSADVAEVFKIATRGLLRRYADQIKTGMTDMELEEALKEVLGIFGGSGGPDSLSVSFSGNGLRIWGGWHVVNHVQEKPLFSGKQTIAMARQLYGIADSGSDQLFLF